MQRGACFVCRAGARSQGVLCIECARKLDREDGLRPEAIYSGHAGHDGGWLVDRWGRLHAVAAPSEVGRHGADVEIVDRATSRRHARLERTDGGWTVTDLDSRNGTFVNDAPLQGRAPLVPGDVVRFGSVALLFVEGPPPEHARASAASTMTMRGPAGDALHTLHVPQPVRLQMREPSLGEGALLTIDDMAVHLTALQHALLSRLAVQNFVDRGKDADVRGFIPSQNLLYGLPWETATPERGHLKRLVSRVRGLLESTGLAIEAHQGLGYRLWSG